MTVLACQAGKDVYVEKPTSVAIAEGRAMVEAARKYQPHRPGRHAAALAAALPEGGRDRARAARIGDITLVRCWNVGNAPPNGIGNPPDGAPPAGLDWDLWLGPAPKVPFNPNRFGVVPDAWSHFRWFWDYAGGMMTDWGVHLIDIVQMAMNVDAPLAVSTIGGKFHLTDNRETPDTILATYQYPGLRDDLREPGLQRPCRSTAASTASSSSAPTATLFVDRERYEIRPEPGRATGRRTSPRPEPTAVNAARADTIPSHQRNFIDCVKSRQAPICDIEIGHRSSSTAILGNMALRSGQTVDVGRQGRARDQRQREGAGAGDARLSRAVEADGLIG